MTSKPISATVLAAALAACAQQPALLNSERIADRFGSYGIDIVAQNDELRYSSLYSTDSGLRTCRTWAIVRFDRVPGELADLHRGVVDGGSIGSTMRDAGWSIEKRTLYIGTIRAAEVSPALRERMQISAGATLAVHLYRLQLHRGGRGIDYATILETHHPDYLDRPQLVALYGTGPGDETVISSFVGLLRSD